MTVKPEVFLKPPPCPGYRIPHIHSVNVRVWVPDRTTGVRDRSLLR